MRALTAAAALTILAALAGAAPAKTPPLTSAERKAIDIASVDAIGVAGLGLAVRVTFKGDIEHALGRGGLTDAVVAMLLTPKGSSRPTQGFITQGAGPVGTTLHRSPTTSFGIVRRGRELTFLVERQPGPLASIAIKTFVGPVKRAIVGRTTASPSAPGTAIPPATWESLEQATAYDEQGVSGSDRWFESADCLILTAHAEIMKRSLERAGSTGARLKSLDRAIASAIEELEGGGGSAKQVAAVARTLTDLTGFEMDADAKPATLLKELRQGARLVKSLIARNAATIKALEGLAARVVAEVDDAPCAISAAFSAEDRKTTYTWVNSREFIYRWTLLPPANDPGCNNEGRLTSTDRELGWYHADSVCDHAKEDPSRGHLGTISLVISAFSAKCTAVYFGSFTGTGPRATCKDSRTANPPKRG